VTSRSLSNRVGGYAYRAKFGDAAIARAGRDGLMARFIREVDPDNQLPEGERLKRADYRRRQHMASLAAKSAASRAARKAAGA
jgi:hypothetical protein